MPVLAPSAARPYVALGRPSVRAGRRTAAARPPRRSVRMMADLTGDASVYIGLGAAAASFAATFFVAPRYSEELKEPDRWEDIYEVLKEEGVDTVLPTEAVSKLQRKGPFSGKPAVLLDVRDDSDFSKYEVPAAVHIPLYRPIQGWDIFSTVRRAGFTFFGVAATERNPAWLEQVVATIPKDQEVMCMCKMGGSIDPGKAKGVKFGFQSRSLKAVYFLREAGYTKVYHVKGGTGDWDRAGLEGLDKVTFRVPGF